MTTAGPADRLRLVNWNCCEGLDRKFPLLRFLDFDVAVVIEAGPFPADLDQVRALSTVSKRAVEQPGHTKCISVIAQDPWVVEELPLVPEHPWLLPVQVRGPVSFTLLAFWALGREWTAERLSYVAQAERLVREVVPAIEGPVVLAGDFNAPIPSTAARHQRNVDALAELGLVDVFTSTNPGVDPVDVPTHYHQWNELRRFHVDHVFVPRQWAPAVTVAVGSFEDWVDAKVSDHVPVMVDLDLAHRPLRQGIRTDSKP